MYEYKIDSGQVYLNTSRFFHKYPKVISKVYKCTLELLKDKELWMSQEDIIKLDATNPNYRSVFYREPSPEEEAILSGLSGEKLDLSKKIYKERKVYYLYTSYEIRPKDKYYDLFFFLSLLYIDILEVDNFLNAQEKIYTSSTNMNYYRFLELLLKKYNDKILIKINPALHEIVSSYIQSKIPKTSYNSSLKWIGNKTEFYQLVYSLFEAQRVTNDDNEVTKVVEELAAVFGIELSGDWQSDLSSSIHDRSNGYKPKIFEEIATAYNRYVEMRIEKKNENKQRKTK